jgi:hypothetical protein
MVFSGTGFGVLVVVVAVSAAHKEDDATRAIVKDNKGALLILFSVHSNFNAIERL